MSDDRNCRRRRNQRQGRKQGQGWGLRLHPHESRALGYLLRHLIVGLAAAMVFEVLILAADLGGLRQLMWASEERWLLAALLLFGLSITFGSLAMGISIMVLGRERD